MAAIVWKGFISFGLVSFPVRLYAAARAERIRFNMLHRKDHSRVKEVWYCAEEDKPIQRDDIVKGYEVSKGEYVVVDEDELKKVAPPTATTMEVLQFVAEDDVDPIYFESSYYIGADSAVSKPYQLFTQALEQTKHHAIAKLSMHGREHIVLIRPNDGGIILHTLYYPDELHEKNRPEAPSGKVQGKELDLAKDLVDKLTEPFKPESFEDEYRKNVERLIEQKQHGKKVTTIAQPKKAKVVDLLEALKKSLKTTAAATPKKRVKAASRPRKRAA